MKGRARVGGGWAIPVALVTVISACGGERAADLPAERLGTSAHFDYYTRSGESDACDSLLGVLERHLDVVREFLDLPWPSGQRVTYRKFSDADDFAQHGGCDADWAAACAPARSVLSPTAFDQHELVHTYLYGVGTPPLLFSEGIAAALTCDPKGIGRRPTISWDQALPPSDPREIYATGAVLVGHMLRSYSSALFMELYRTLPRSAGPSEVDAAIRVLYDGLSAEELWQNALAARPGCVPIWPCGQEPIALDGSPATVGTQCGLELDYRTVAAPTGGDLLISTVDQRGMRLLACDERVPPDTVIAQAALSTGLGLAQVDPGPYYLEFENRPSEVAATFATPGWAGPDCTQLEALTMPSDPDAVLRVVIPPLTTSWFVKLRLGEPHRFAVGSRDSMMFSACASCTPDADCVSMPLFEHGYTATWNGDYVLHFQPATLDPIDPERPFPTAAELVGY